MGYILSLDGESKILTLCSNTTTYVGENNADTITCLFPTQFRGYDLKDCFIILHILIPADNESVDNNIDNDNVINGNIVDGDSVELVIEEESYKGRYVSYFNISNIYTQKEQLVYLKLEILNGDKILAYTNEVSFFVAPNRTISDVITSDSDNLQVFEKYFSETQELLSKSEEALVSINEYMDKMQNMYNEMQSIYNECVEIRDEIKNNSGTANGTDNIE